MVVSSSSPVILIGPSPRSINTRNDPSIIASYATWYISPVSSTTSSGRLSIPALNWMVKFSERFSSLISMIISSTWYVQVFPISHVGTSASYDIELGLLFVLFFILFISSTFPATEKNVVTSIMHIKIPTILPFILSPREI